MLISLGPVDREGVRVFEGPRIPAGESEADENPGVGRNLAFLDNMRRPRGTSGCEPGGEQAQVLVDGAWDERAVGAELVLPFRVVGQVPECAAEHVRCRLQPAGDDERDRIDLVRPRHRNAVELEVENQLQQVVARVLRLPGVQLLVHVGCDGTPRCRSIFGRTEVRLVQQRHQLGNVARRGSEDLAEEEQPRVRIDESADQIGRGRGVQTVQQFVGHILDPGAVAADGHRGEERHQGLTPLRVVRRIKLDRDQPRLHRVAVGVDTVAADELLGLSGEGLHVLVPADQPVVLVGIVGDRALLGQVRHRRLEVRREAGIDDAHAVVGIAQERVFGQDYLLIERCDLGRGRDAHFMIVNIYEEI